LLPITTENLISDVRALLDETNTATVSDAKILKAINMSAREVYHIVAKQYDSTYMSKKSFITDGTEFLSIPDDAFGNRVEFVTYSNGVQQIRLQSLVASKLHRLSIPMSSPFPHAYTTNKHTIELSPKPNAGVTGFIHYMQKPATLVKPYGRIIDLTNNVFTLTSTENMSTDVDSLGAFVSVVDAETGISKGCFQVASITGNEVSIKTTSLSRVFVYGNDILDTAPTTIASDDYMCPIGGTCVMEVISDYSDYITYKSMATLKSALQVPLSQYEMDTINAYKKNVESIWSGRDNDNTVSNRNPHFINNYGAKTIRRGRR
jgi:hypothetical protein